MKMELAPSRYAWFLNNKSIPSEGAGALITRSTVLDCVLETQGIVINYSIPLAQVVE